MKFENGLILGFCDTFLTTEVHSIDDKTMIVNSEFKDSEVDEAYFGTLSQHSPGKIDEEDEEHEEPLRYSYQSSRDLKSVTPRAVCTPYSNVLGSKTGLRETVKLWNGFNQPRTESNNEI
jgi:hypothetical protein